MRVSVSASESAAITQTGRGQREEARLRRDLEVGRGDVVVVVRGGAVYIAFRGLRVDVEAGPSQVVNNNHRIAVAGTPGLLAQAVEATQSLPALPQPCLPTSSPDIYAQRSCDMTAALWPHSSSPNSLEKPVTLQTQLWQTLRS